MELQMEKKRSSLGYYFRQVLYLIPIVITLHYFQTEILNLFHFRYKPQTYLDVVDMPEIHCKKLLFEMTHLHKEIKDLKEEMEELRSRVIDAEEDFQIKLTKAFDKFYLDQIGMFDYASAYAGGSIISTPDTTPLPSQFAFRFLGAFGWMGSSSPNVLLQHNLVPGNFYGFYGDRARILIKLGHPVIITHVSLEHQRFAENLITAAPREFQVLGYSDSGRENLGNFIYKLNDPIIQTFQVIPKNCTFENIELRILSNHGNYESTYLYRFRVHSVNLNLK